jgi:chemotaxis regulatin CheY-phosphate phosphatase CheZ
MSTSTHTQVQHFLDKLEELRAVFVLGRRSFPFLKEIIQFVQDITVLLEEVDATIEEQTGHMPRATSRLKSVSEATELATSEILDIIDDVLDTLGTLEGTLQATESHFDDLAEADEKLLTLLQDELGPEHASLLTAAERIGREKRTIRDNARDNVDAAVEALAPIRSRMNRITMSLQVQDITAQQIASVNHLIESVRSRMNALLSRLGSGVSPSEASDDVGASPRTAPFDSNARYDHSSDRQNMADDLVASMSGAEDDPSAPSNESAADAQAASEADINEIFGSDPSTNDHAAETPSAPDARETSPPSTDADADNGQVASQEDIDELFQQGL